MKKARFQWRQTQAISCWRAGRPAQSKSSLTDEVAPTGSPIFSALGFTLRGITTPTSALFRDRMRSDMKAVRTLRGTRVSSQLYSWGFGAPYTTRRPHGLHSFSCFLHGLSHQDCQCKAPADRPTAIRAGSVPMTCL